MDTCSGWPYGCSQSGSLLLMGFGAQAYSKGSGFRGTLDAPRQGIDFDVPIGLCGPGAPLP